MNQSEKQIILVKLQELTNFIQGIPAKEATLFDNVEQQTPAEETGTTDNDAPVAEKKRRTRVVVKDGTMSAQTIANHLTKELGREIPRESVIQVGRKINAKPIYCERQHNSRYTPEAVSSIMGIFRSLIKL